MTKNSSAAQRPLPPRVAEEAPETGIPPFHAGPPRLAAAPKGPPERHETRCRAAAKRRMRAPEALARPGNAMAVRGHAQIIAPIGLRSTLFSRRKRGLVSPTPPAFPSA